MKHTTVCHTSAIGESTQWKGEIGSRKVKVNSHFNVCLQNGACCFVKEADEVVSIAHRSSMATGTTQESDKEEWTKRVWHLNARTHTKQCVGKKGNGSVRLWKSKMTTTMTNHSIPITLSSNTIISTILLQTHYENIKGDENNLKNVNGSDSKKKGFFVLCHSHVHFLKHSPSVVLHNHALA